MDRSNHYEAAFEAYLQHHRLCYVAVDETRRAMLGDLRVKSLDFVVYGDAGARLLIDVKGRRFPTGPSHRLRRVWESWSTQDDISGLEQWTSLFGPGYQAVLVFVYHVLPVVTLPDDVPDLWTWHGRRYLLRGVPAEQYRVHMRVRSPKWATVGLPGAVFRDLVQPFQDFTRRPVGACDECPF
ncbi:MAG TPA: HYExAFE family protein [Gemmataceae bacterium]|jgi:hypothetical protein|nr:HYExAFE family protein [Gemmataceae bacterium]